MMKISVRILLVTLVASLVSTTAFAQIGQQRSPYYNSSFQIQDQPAAVDSNQQDSPELPAGNSIPPTQLPMPSPAQSTQLPAEPSDPAESQVLPPPTSTPIDSEEAKLPAPQKEVIIQDWPNDGAPVMNFQSAPMTMPPSFQQSPCCPDHAHGTPHMHSVISPPAMSGRSFHLSDSVNQGPAMTPHPTPSIGEWCQQCGDSCDGNCRRRLLGNRRGVRKSSPSFEASTINGASLGQGLGSNVGKVRGLFQDQPMYAFFDFSGFFSESESLFSNGMPGQQSGAPFGHKDSFGFGAGLGQYVTNDFRVDISARNRYVELENQIPGAGGQAYLADGGADVWTGMLNGRHNLPGFHPCIKPYLSVGIGMAYHRSQAATRISGPGGLGPFESHLNEETTDFAWSVGAGISFKMTSKMFFDLDYQYIDLGDATTGIAPINGAVLFDDLQANEVAFRLRFNF